MIGSGLKKLAEEHGMCIDKGVAYGSLGGFSTTMCEGAGYKQITFAASVADAVKLTELQTTLNGRNLQKEFRVTSLTFAPKSVRVVFHDNPGTMKKIREFLDFFLPLLEDAGASRAGICPECGFEVEGGCWKMIDETAYYMHAACADKVCREIAAENETREEEDGGNYVTGLVGALLGAVLGAVLWAVVMWLGYVAAIVGFAIGWLAERGYHLLKGRQGKGKIAILIVAVIFGVLLGNLGADVISLAQMINEGYFEGMVYADIPYLILLNLLDNPEYLSATIRSIVMGLVFAALGVWSLLRRANAEVSGPKIVDLK